MKNYFNKGVLSALTTVMVLAVVVSCQLHEPHEKIVCEYVAIPSNVSVTCLAGGIYLAGIDVIYEVSPVTKDDWNALTSAYVNGIGISDISKGLLLHHGVLAPSAQTRTLSRWNATDYSFVEVYENSSTSWVIVIHK